MEIHQFRFMASDVAVAPPRLENRRKRQKLEAVVPTLSPRICNNAAENSKIDVDKSKLAGNKEEVENKCLQPGCTTVSWSSTAEQAGLMAGAPKFGMTSVCGRRRDMEDAVAIHPRFSQGNLESPSNLHFFGVYDGHGCSHVR